MNRAWPRACHVTVHHSDYGSVSADCVVHGLGRRASRNDPAEAATVSIEAAWYIDEDGNEAALPMPISRAMRDAIEDAATNKVTE